jgi:DNA-binding MarR family transcriptional regulator
MNTPIVKDFTYTYPILSPIQKKIWETLHSYSKKHKRVIPSQKCIADRVSCTAKYVSRVITSFRKRGWLSVRHRAANRAEYFINKDLLLLDPKEQNNYLKN